MLVQPQSMEKVRRSTNDLYFVAQGGDMVRVETNDQNGAFQTDEVPFCTHCPQAYRRPPDSELEPDLTGYLQPYREEIQAFLQEPLVNNPERAVFLSQLLKTPGEIIRESQRLHFNIIGDVLKKYKAAMLFDIADFENKGDPCITVGEILFLARINLPVVYYCSSLSCTDENMRKARKLAANYSPDELVVLFHGGGNLVGYRFNDFFRFKTMDLFAGYHFLLFPQSIFYNNAQDEHVKLCEREYCCNENLTLVLRDLQTYSFAKEHFKGKTKLLLAPDIAFQIGNVNRFQSPVFDVMWIKRIDYEAPNYGSIPEHPSDVRFHVSDWWSWKTNDAPTSLEKAFYVSVEGFNFLSRGRVLVTDRLHGHILSTLMNMPHVLVDNRYKKLSSYHNSWTKGLENTKLTNQPEKAMAMILDLLDVHQQDLPPRVPFMDLAENFQQRNFEEEEFAKYS
ncbi:pyruvyl transferase 1 [Aplysia californica]|uniref:Pyruvyl transferase 1 n=1 Tax=Aplysia californica TaxID=6500 RepID=A0ABM0JU41_APLCA|nr:pyruvyl transferase 1 [Aplysia californica]